MFLYLIKKTIFDSLENFMKVIFYNLLIVFGIGLVFSTLLKLNNFYSLPFAVFIFILNIISLGFLSLFYKNKDLKDLLLKSSVLGGVSALLTVIGFNAMIFYQNIKNHLLSNSISLFIFWIIIFWCVISIFSMCIILNNPNKENYKSLIGIIKKSFIFSITNIKEIALFFPIFILVFIFTPTVIIGGGTSLILLINFYKIIKLKENYLNNHINCHDIEKVSWKIILEDERKILDRKKFKDIILPWQK